MADRTPGPRGILGTTSPILRREVQDAAVQNYGFPLPFALSKIVCTPSPGGMKSRGVTVTREPGHPVLTAAAARLLHNPI